VTPTIRVQCASRLHFGLLSLPAAGRDQSALPARSFGGIGLMVHDPGLAVTVCPADAWHAEGPLAGRALEYARRFVLTLPADRRRPYGVCVERSAPEHAGLGTGTQLGLALTRALAVAAGQAELDAVELAHRVGRGRRSALGVHGFARGGLLVDAGKHDPETVAPLVARHPFPEAWRILLVLPRRSAGLHGAEESQAFERLHAQGIAPERTERLCRLVLLGLLPALVEMDCRAFGEALYELNVLVGEAFAVVQGGVYAGARVADVVTFIRRQGVAGVGQSSWGPTVFAVVENEAQGRQLAGRVQGRFGLDLGEVLLTPACNHGAVTASSPPSSGR
jgi:beta-RFAP synthase